MRLTMQKLLNAIRLYRFGTFLLMLNRLFHRFFRYQTIIFYDIDLEDKATHYPKAGELSFRKIRGAGDKYFTKLLRAFPGNDFDERIREPAKEGYIAFYGEQVAGYGWITREEFYIDELNYAYPLMEDEFFIYDCFISPQFRGRGIYPAMLQAILRDYYLYKACRRACIGVASANRGSRRGVSKAGFREFNRITYCRWLGRERWWGKIGGWRPKNRRDRYCLTIVC